MVGKLVSNIMVIGISVTLPPCKN